MLTPKLLRGLLPPPSLNPDNRLLLESMAWLNTHHLIYLPIGIEPFQEGSQRSSRLKAVELMKDHIELIASLLTVDLDNITDLQE